MKKIHMFKVEAKSRFNELKREKISIKLKEHQRVSIKREKKKKGERNKKNLTYKSLWK